MGMLVPELIIASQFRFSMMSDYVILFTKTIEAGHDFLFPAILRKTQAKLAKMGPHLVLF